jgi:hypothetical protein
LTSKHAKSNLSQNKFFSGPDQGSRFGISAELDFSQVLSSKFLLENRTEPDFSSTIMPPPPPIALMHAGKEKEKSRKRKRSDNDNDNNNDDDESDDDADDAPGTGMFMHHLLQL